MKKFPSNPAAADSLMVSEPAAARVAVVHFAPVVTGNAIRLDNAEPMMYSATQLTRPFPCTVAQ